MKRIALAAFTIISCVLAPAGAATKVSVDEACAACTAAGVKPVGTAVQSPLRKESSLIGMAYLNYIYQNDITNEHFCQAMLLMNSQVPAGTNNPYVRLFDAGRGEKTLRVLEDIQLSFDYSIGRSQPAEEKLQASIDKISATLKK